MSEIKKIFGEVLPKLTFVDIGAMSLGTEPYAALVDQGIGTVIGFEPLPEECEILNQKQNNSGHLFLPYAIGDGSTGVFNICNYPMTSSLFKPNMPLLEMFQNLAELTQVIRSEPVTTKRLDDIAEVSEADYLKMDAQGAELAILQGARRLLEQVMIVHTEVEFVPMYVGQPLFADVDTELRRQGFLLHRFQSMAGRPFKPFTLDNSQNSPISQVLWADVVYVKDFTKFDVLPPRKLLKMAIMLHELYQSYDLSALAIKSFDEQTGFRLYDHYCNSIPNPRSS